MSVSQEQRETLAARLGQTEGVVSIQVYPGASVKPPADVMVLLVANSHLPEVMRLLEGEDGRKPASLTITEPDAAFSASQQHELDIDVMETAWEESALFLQRSSQVTHNFLLLMAFSGVMAAAGLSTGVLHLVVAAMLVIPGFAPLLDIPFGLVLGNRHMIRLGLRSTAIGYAVFALSAAAAFHVLRLTGQTSVSAFLGMPMVQYWTSFSLSGALVSLAAAAAGATIVPTHRSVLTAGVMVALALVPGAAIFGIGLSVGLWETAVRGGLHWLRELATILAAGLVLFSAKNRLIHRRTSWY